VLEELRRAQPGLRVAERWLTALDARRIGRVALLGAEPERGRLAAAFWLDGQKPAWIRTAAASAAARLGAEARLQADLALPGVAPVVEDGIASGIPYVAVAGPGQPLSLMSSRPFDLAAALRLAAAGARLLRALALAGVALPDAEPERFLHTPAPSLALTLADLDGAYPAEPAAAAHAHATLAAGFARRILPDGTWGHLTTEVGDALRQAVGEPPGLTELIALLDRAALRVGRD
jgi:hypothetical protein